MKTQQLVIGAAAATAAYLLYKKYSERSQPVITTLDEIPNVQDPAPPILVTLMPSETPRIFFPTNAANIGAAKSYGNCQCKNGSQCVGHGDCSCCDQQKASWNCLKNPNAPGCNPMIILPFTTNQRASWNCLKNPNAPGCNPTATATVQAQRIGACTYAYAL